MKQVLLDELLDRDFVPTTCHDNASPDMGAWSP
jgi:hypothetical protein